MRIAVVGSGYVGLVAGACFADLGHDVILVDNDEQKLAALWPVDVTAMPAVKSRKRLPSRLTTIPIGYECFWKLSRTTRSPNGGALMSHWTA